MSVVSDHLPFVVLGLTDGSVYALAAMGLVVTYKTSGVLNFAHGAIAMVGAYAYYAFKVQVGLPTVIALLLIVLGVGPLVGLFIDRALLTRLQGATTTAYIVVSIGLLVLLQGGAIVLYGAPTRFVPQIFPSGTVQLPGVAVSYGQMAVVAIAAASGLGLALFFKRTHTGLQMRAVVGDPGLTSLTGGDARRIRSLSWMLGCSFAALAGALLAPTLGVDSTTLILLVVQAFAAATVGGLTSLPITYAAALAINVGGDVSKKYVPTHPLLQGFPASLPFIVLLLVLVVSRRGRFVEVARTAQRSATRTRRAVAPRLPVGTLLGLAAVGLVVPALVNGPHLTTATATLPFILMFASLSLLVGLSRQVSLCHVVFFGLGATTLSHLQQQGIPWLPALLLAGLVLVPVGALLAIPAIRLSGLFLALATFGFGVLAQNLLFNTGLVFGDKAGRDVARPRALGVDFAAPVSFFYLSLVMVLAGLVLTEVIRATRLGRLLRGLADSPTAVQSLAVDPTSARVLVFCISSFLAAIAGGLYATDVHSVAPADLTFLQSLEWVAVLAAAGTRTLAGSVTAAVLLVTLPGIITDTTFLQYEPIGFGVLAILLAQSDNGLVGLLHLDLRALAARSSWRLQINRHRERVSA